MLVAKLDEIARTDEAATVAAFVEYVRAQVSGDRVS
jgi:hypothetical protein